MGSQLSSPIQTKWVASYLLPSFSISAVEMQGRQPEMEDYYLAELFPRKEKSQVDLFLGNKLFEENDSAGGTGLGIKARITDHKEFLEVEMECKDKQDCCFVIYENGLVEPATKKTKLSGKDILLLSSQMILKEFIKGPFPDLNKFTIQLLNTMLEKGSLTNFAVVAIQMGPNVIPLSKKECYVGFCNSRDVHLQKRYESDVRNHVSDHKMIEKIISESKQKRKQEMIIKLSEGPLVFFNETAPVVPLNADINKPKKKRKNTVTPSKEQRKSKRVRFNVDRYGLFA